jgi:hypothetical protein
MKYSTLMSKAIQIKQRPKPPQREKLTPLGPLSVFISIPLFRP